MPTVRRVTHAGSWYSSDPQELDEQLDGWLAQVPSSTTPIGELSSQEGEVSIPHANARAIIAPHAGYSYSGPAAAWAYKSADWTKVKRVFLFGPSHHSYFTYAATTRCDEYATPLGKLTIDKDLVANISQEWGLDTMDRETDENEHSLEMHLPYIYKMLSLHNEEFKNNSSAVSLIPILIGSTNASAERRLGKHLAPYFDDPSTIFVISSDFCHWGSRFRYTLYRRPSGTQMKLSSNNASAATKDHPIHESIKEVDFESMNAVEDGSHADFLEQLENTGNTVCGRHPIGVFMAAVEASESTIASEKGRFKFLRYERSSKVKALNESSVSYCSAFAVL